MSGAVRIIAFALGAAVACSGCVSARLRALEERQLTTELREMDEASKYLSTPPVLGTTYAARAFVSSRALNEALDGYSGYNIPLKSPRGSTLYIDNADLEFRDGALGVMVQARAANKKGDIEVKLRVRADFITEVVAGKSTLSMRPLVREIVPDIRVSIFRFREFWFAHRLLLLPAQKYADAMPAIESEIDLNFDVDLPGGERRETIRTDDGTISVKFDTPPLHHQFKYAVTKVIYLREGMYLFISPGAPQ